MLGLINKFKPAASIGLKLDEHKPGTAAPIIKLPLPELLILPLQQHQGKPGKPTVRVGERVFKGQSLSDGDADRVPIHAPTSGTIEKMDHHWSPTKEQSTLCLFLSTDGQHQSIAETPLCDQYQEQVPDELISYLHNKGIVGLGGAAFPTAQKLRQGIKTLIINGAECEPYITCDHALMRHRATEIVKGAQILAFISGAKKIFIALEENKQDAIAALSIASQTAADDRLEIVCIPTRYPSGGERQLIQQLLHTEIPSGAHPSNIGILCFNPATVYAAYQAIYFAEALCSRIVTVTVTGAGVAAPQNFEVLIGTPIKELIAAAEPINTEVQIIMGGPMMGIHLPITNAPITKASNCILVTPKTTFSADHKPSACIRCGDCAPACPAKLQPQQLYWHIQAKEYDKAKTLNLADCIECGCCAYVCPSKIPLVDYYRSAKDTLKQIENDAQAAKQAKQRHQARELRLAHIEQEREQKREQHRKQIRNSKDTREQFVRNAIARAKRKKQPN